MLLTKRANDGLTADDQDASDGCLQRYGMVIVHLLPVTLVKPVSFGIGLTPFPWHRQTGHGGFLNESPTQPPTNRFTVCGFRTPRNKSEFRIHEKAPTGGAFHSVIAQGWRSVHLFLAEEAGFEPAVGLTLRTLSRRMT